MTHWARKVAESFEPVDQADEIPIVAMIREAREHAGMPARAPWRPLAELIAEAEARNAVIEADIRAGRMPRAWTGETG